MSASLVGSEMCIRDSHTPVCQFAPRLEGPRQESWWKLACSQPATQWSTCLLYTSDAADDM
eukprot:10476894-Alexandrium_andersonii.AAC.1